MKIVYCDINALGWWFRPIESMQRGLRVISSVYTSIPRVMVTGFFGAETRQAVEVFQREFELPPTGEIDFATWELILEVYKNLEALQVGGGCCNLGVPAGEVVALKRGEGDCCLLEILQAVLNNFARQYGNLPEVAQNDQYDAVTARAVASFQKIANLPANGVLDRRTWNTMLEFYSSSVGG